jgi:hypothetical protein
MYYSHNKPRGKNNYTSWCRREWPLSSHHQVTIKKPPLSICPALTSCVTTPKNSSREIVSNLVHIMQCNLILAHNSLSKNAQGARRNKIWNGPMEDNGGKMMDDTDVGMNGECDKPSFD